MEADRNDKFHLAQRRKALMLTQAELAVALGCSPTTVWSWEAGRTPIRLKLQRALVALEKKAHTHPKKPGYQSKIQKLRRQTGVQVPHVWFSYNLRKEIAHDEAQGRCAEGKQVWAATHSGFLELWGVDGRFEFTGRKEKYTREIMMPAFAHIADDV